MKEAVGFSVLHGPWKVCLDCERSPQDLLDLNYGVFKACLSTFKKICFMLLTWDINKKIKLTDLACSSRKELGSLEKHTRYFMEDIICHPTDNLIFLLETEKWTLWRDILLIEWYVISIFIMQYSLFFLSFPSSSVCKSVVNTSEVS